MADDAEKTEQPTPRRREEARSRGQVARSQDFSAAVLLLVGLLTLEILGRGMLERLGAMMQSLLDGTGGATVVGPQLVPLGANAAAEMISIMVPILLVLFVAAVLVALSQTGLLFTATPLKISLDKLNPVTGFKRIFSGRFVVLLFINVAKLGIVGGVIYYWMVEQMDKILFASTLVFTEMVQMAMTMFVGLGVRVALVLIVLGIVDWFYQRHKHERSLRMSKQEVKEEMRRMEGDPLMKRRRREVQLQLALQRLKSAVPRADVVVTNPTEIAVALKYAPETMSAPTVVAKGHGYVAQRIRELAIEAGIVVVEKKPLAQALDRLVEVGQEIPPDLYKAVAEVLAYVYELSGQHRRMKSTVAGATA